jgi:hypothetical protein
MITASGMRTRLSALVRSKWAVMGAAVLALAAVILVAAALSAPRAGNQLPSVVTSPAVTPADALVAQAQLAQSTGDTTRAVQLAKRAVAADSSNAAAQSVLQQLTQKDPASGGKKDSTTGGKKKPAPSPATGSGFDKPVADLRKLLPSSIGGMSRLMYEVDTEDAQVPFNPRNDDVGLSGVLFSVHDRGSAAAAQVFLDKVVKVAFSDDGVSTRVGSAPAYFGRNGNIGELGFVRGRFAFEVAITAAGVAPAQMVKIAVSLASNVPTRTP